MDIFAIIIFILIMLNTFYMGFNDGSNAIATTVATRAIKPTTAIIIGAVTTFVVPIIVLLMSMSSESAFSVAGNISGKTIYQQYIEGINQTKAFIFLLATMIGSISWGLIAYKLKVPNSTSHTLSGGLIGTSIAAFGFSSIQWTEFVLFNVVIMVALAPLIGLVISFILMKITKKLARRATMGFNNILIFIQRLNIIILASSFSSNNFQKSLGIFMLMGTLGLVATNQDILWVVIAISAAMTLGLLLGGYRIINTLGRKIFKLNSTHSVVAQLTTGLVMTVATYAGISVSTGQIMSSSIIGVGAAEQMNRVKWNTAKRIVISWFLTLPISAMFSAAFYLVVGKLILGL